MKRRDRVAIANVRHERKTASSNYQVTLVDKTDKGIPPMEYPRINRFFDSLDDRNAFVTMFESTVNKSGGKLVLNDKIRHPLFTSFYIYDNQGNLNYDITVYH